MGWQLLKIIGSWGLFSRGRAVLKTSLVVSKALVTEGNPASVKLLFEKYILNTDQYILSIISI